jgi:peptidoglycan/xylan/chitin deacetylase (PgdA/CDA1 family)
VSSPPPTYYRARRDERRLRTRRRRLLALAVVAALSALALALALAGPWFDHFGLVWPGGASDGRGGSGAASGGQSGAASGADGSLRIVGAEDLWHNGPVTLRFRDAAGRPVAADWRMDGGAWQAGKRARVSGPADHSNDGMHTVEARPVGGVGVAASAKVGIDTTPPEVTAAKVAPKRTDGTGALTLSFIAPAEGGVTVDWSVVDVLDKPVGEKGAPAPPSGLVTVKWQIPKVGGEKLGPGTYWLRVQATDAAGNVTEVRASVACVHPVKARVISSLPAAGKEVALTFDGGSGYAWRSLMNELYSHDQLGTWFCTGQSIDKYPQMAQLAAEQGQTIGNHSYDHPDFSTISYAEQVSQLNRNAAAWWKACKAIPQPFFRPPYGSQTATTVKAAGQAGYRYVVMWTGDAGDWRGLPASQVAANALAAAKPGAIILFHTQWNSRAALPAVLKGLKARGLKAVSLAQLCADAGLPY